MTGPARWSRASGEVFDPEDLAELRSLTTAGETDVSWERGRFRNNLEVADPAGLTAFLERHGIRMR